MAIVSPDKGRKVGEGYEDTAEGVASAEWPLSRLSGWVPGERVKYQGRNHTILAISDNGLYLGYVHCGRSIVHSYVTGEALDSVRSVT